MFKQIVVFLGALALSVTAIGTQAVKTPLAGTIAAIEGDHISIKDQAGETHIVMLQKNTKYLKSEKTVTRKELKVGTPVLIDVKMDEKMKMYAAQQVTIGTAATNSQPSGTGGTKAR